MGILKIIYLCTVVSYLLIMTLITLVARSRFKKEYPDLIVHKDTFLEKVTTCVRMLLIAMCPALNIFMTMVMVLKYDEIVTVIIEKVAEEAEEKEI